jgi:AmiR/NasT family two-component response regulator
VDVVRIIDAAGLADPPARPFLVVASTDLAPDLSMVLAAGASGYFIAPVNLLSLAAAICVASREICSNADLTRHSEKLALAADENRTVGVVVGMLMERYHVPRDAAYACLRSYSRTQRLRVSDVATRVLASTDDHFKLSHGIWAAALSGPGAAQPPSTTPR